MPVEAQRRAYLDALGIELWALRDAEPPAAETPENSPAGNAQAADWSELEQQVAACTLCALHRTRTQTVFGVGSQSADWMIIGEAPGAEEDRRGEPFVGRAGKLLDEMLRSVGLDRDRVFIANILKCRPPNNRDPAVNEAAACRPYLERQIALLQPKLILAVGRIAAQQLLQSDAPLGRLRGQKHYLHGGQLPVIVTYHPAYLLRSPAQKRKAWEDLCLARQIVDELTA
ncbi:MAG: uracil-DNA glycosylase [Woeseiaceae bacterium]|nr:uracil-DNA glycosylase [Woeseiaceae bacterium]